MEKENYIQDLKNINQMMIKSTPFLSLSGISGILAGIYALIGGYFANAIIQKKQIVDYNTDRHSIALILFIAFMVLLMSIITAVYFSFKKAKKNNESLFNSSSKQVLISFLIPLLAGATVLFLVLKTEHFRFLVPFALLFYGLASENASKYTYRNVRYLGIIMILLGILGFQFNEYSLLFWYLGFGISHIVYGTWMYFKYDRN